MSLSLHLSSSLVRLVRMGPQTHLVVSIHVFAWYMFTYFISYGKLKITLYWQLYSQFLPIWPWYTWYTSSSVPLGCYISLQFFVKGFFQPSTGRKISSGVSQNVRREYIHTLLARHAKFGPCSLLLIPAGLSGMVLDTIGISTLLRVCDTC